MKILQIISASYPPREGVGSHVYSLSKWLTTKNHDVTIAIRDHSVTKPKKFNENGVNYILVPVFNVPFLSTSFYWFSLKKIFKNQKFDIIHYHSPLVSYYPLNSKKTILTIHSTMKIDTSFIEPISFHAILNKIMGKYLSPIYERKLIKNCDELITVCKDINNELEVGYGYENLKLTYIPNGIDDNLYHNLRIDKKNQILFVGRLGYRKGIPNLLKAINQLKTFIRENNFRFIFCGKGDLEKFCYNFVNSNELNDIVSFTYKSQKELNLLYNESKYLIMNSTYETGPRTILEAIHANTNFIATNVGLLNSISKKDYIEIRGFKTDDVINAIKIAISDYKKFNLSKYKKEFCNNRLSQKILDIYEK